MIKAPNWVFEKKLTKKIQVLEINEKYREVDALDLDVGMPFCLDAVKEFDLEEVEKGESYVATVKVYRGAIGPELEKHFSKMGKEDSSFAKGVQMMKASGDAQPLFKFDLISVRPLANKTP